MLTAIKRACLSVAQFFKERQMTLLLSVIGIGLLVLVLWPFVVTTVNSGEAGVLFWRFSGVELRRVFQEGLYFRWPWNKIFVYDLRLQTERRDVKVLANNGLTVTLKVAIRYHADYRTLPQLHQTVGPDYLERVVLPETIAALRREAGAYAPEELYNTRQGLLDRVELTALEESAQRFVLIDAVLIESVELPDVIKTAIEEKLDYEQKYLAYQFRLQLEQREAERKQIEATGIRNYNATVAENLTEELIRWQAVQASKELAQSNNAKIILFGGQGQLPVILGGVDSPVPAPPTPPARAAGPGRGGR